MSTCEPHVSAKLTTDGSSSLTNWCPECRQRICFRCSKAAPESWMSGSCHDCYRIIERENKARQAEYAHEREMEKLADAWDEGFKSGWAEATDPGGFVNDVWDSKTPNPYRAGETK